MEEAFVYIWHDLGNQKYYIGSHKGSQDDGYVCSSKTVLGEYKERPRDFFRKIVAEGPYEEIVELETEMLIKVNAKHNPLYYNMHNGDGKFCQSGPLTEATKAKISLANKGKRRPNISAAQMGRRFSKEAKHKMSLSHMGKIPWNKGLKGVQIPSEETRLKMSLLRRGVPRSAETKAKISIARLGKSRPEFSTEWKSNMSIAQKNRQSREKNERAASK